jgi:hypothetical protein
MYISQDLAFSFSRLPIKLYLRYAIFDTKDLNSCVYAYENDLLYAFSVLCNTTRDRGSYAMERFSPLNLLIYGLSIRLHIMQRNSSIGSDLSLIEGNTKSRCECKCW